MKIIGITGGTGSGKTSALRCLEAMGAYVIDCDAVYHELLRNNKQMLAELDGAFPGVVKDGVLDRKALGSVVFGRESALMLLNSITHRYVGQEVDRQLRQQEAQGREVSAIDAIALLESDIKERCDFTVGIIAPTELRVSRLMKREGISEDYARLRISAQQPSEYFIKNCDHILESTDNDIDAFNEKCRALFGNLLYGGQNERENRN